MPPPAASPPAPAPTTRHTERRRPTPETPPPPHKARGPRSFLPHHYPSHTVVFAGTTLPSNGPDATRTSPSSVPRSARETGVSPKLVTQRMAPLVKASTSAG